jgi:hypothetical protein
MPVTPRRYTLESQDASARAARKLGTYTARALHLAVVYQGGTNHMDHTTLCALLGMAHHQDMHEAAGESAIITYPEDVGDIIGWSASRAAAFLRQVVRLGLIKGTARAGYVLAGEMVRPRR